MFKAINIGFLCAISLVFMASGAMAQRVEAEKESRPYSNYDLASEDLPSTDPVTVIEEAMDPNGGVIEADPENFDFQPFYISECNTCRGSSFVESYAAMPEKARGIWSYPDCSNVKDVLFQTKYFAMWNNIGRTLCLEPVKSVTEYPSFFSALMSSGETYVTITNDGLMRTAVPPQDVSVELKQKYRDENWDIEKAGSSMGREYASCGFYPKEEFEILNYAETLLQELDKIIDKCAIDESKGTYTKEQKGRIRAQCGTFIFAQMDKDKSKNLDYLELTEATFKAFLIKDMMSKCVGGATYRRRKNDAILDVVNNLIGALDKNGDLKLSKKELSALDAYFNQQGDVSLETRYKDLLSFFPFLTPPLNLDLTKLKHD